MICPTCGFENLNESSFCTKCRFKLHEGQNRNESHNTPYPTLHSPPIALFLSCLIPGAGHAYIGNFKKAFSLFAAVLITLLLAGYFFGTFGHFVFFMLFSVIAVYAISDSYLSTLKERGKDISPENVKRIQQDVGIGFGIISLIIILYVSNLFNRHYSTYTLQYDVPILNLKRSDRIFVKNDYYESHQPKIDDAIVYSGAPGKIIEIDSSGIDINVVYERVYDRLDAERLQKIAIPKENLKSVKKIYFIFAPLSRRRML